MTKLTIKSASLAAWLLALAVVTNADTLILKDGTQHDGTFVSGTETTITFRENGTLARYNTDRIDSIQFGPLQSSNERDLNNQQQENYRDNESPQQNSNMRRGPEIPAGTELAIRTNETIDSKNAGYNQTFSGQVDEDVRDESGQILIPRGSEAQLMIKQVRSGGTVGTPDLTLDVQSVTINGQRYVIDTSDVVQKGTSGLGKNKRTGELVGGGAVLGTIIGAIAGGGKGAAIGAAGGAAAGAGTEVLTRGKDVRVPSETVLRFKLDQPVRLVS